MNDTQISELAEENAIIQSWMVRVFIAGYKKAMEIELGKELKRIMQDDPVTFFLVNISNYLTPEQMKIVSDKLVEWTTESNHELMQRAFKTSWIKYVEYLNNLGK